MVLKRSILFFLILFLSMFSFNVSAADLSRITLSQACLDFPRISVYLDIRDSAEQEVTDIKSEQFNVSLGEYPLKVTGMTKWSDADEGIGYVMLVDVSRSLSPEQFKQMKLSVEDWIDSLQVKDRMAIISFGNQVNVVHDYTGDKAALKTVVADLVPVEDGTQFNAGIAKGLELSRLVSVGLPNRREIIVVSDGQEDYAGGVNRQEILRQIDEERIPIYAIGLYSPPNTPQKEEALKNMGEFARVSNGEFIKAESASLREISSYLHKAMSRGLILWLDCSNCKADGQLQRLQIKLNMHNTTLSQGMNLRLLHSNTPIEKKEGTRSFLESRPLWQYITSGVVLLLLIILTCYLFSRKRTMTNETLTKHLQH